MATRARASRLLPSRHAGIGLEKLDRTRLFGASDLIIPCEVF
jgi:hypothetical protein